MPMEGVLSRLGWFVVLSVVVAYGISSIGGSIVNAREARLDKPILIRDEIQGNAHQLSGMVTVPSVCDQLSVETKAISPTNYVLVFKTWPEPSIPCDGNPVPRVFRATVFGPATGTYFTATLDGIALPIAVVPAQ